MSTESVEQKTEMEYAVLLPDGTYCGSFPERDNRGSKYTEEGERRTLAGNVQILIWSRREHADHIAEEMARIAKSAGAVGYQAVVVERSVVTTYNPWIASKAPVYKEAAF